MPTVLEGKSVASRLSRRLKQTIEEHRASNPSLPSPKLAILQVGDHAASKAYIAHKIKFAAAIGARTDHVRLAASASEDEIRAALARLAEDADVHGIIVQLPLDQSVRSPDVFVSELLDAIPPEKDADGLHTANLGRLFVGQSTPAAWTSPLPATALGVMRLLEHHGVGVRGKTCVVIGKSRLVGNPTAQLLLHAGATVTVLHSQSPEWSEHTRAADIVVAAAGVRHLLKPEQIRDTTTVVDVGIHRTEAGLTGDAHPECYAKSTAYTPVPGGVGQLTVACLMENLVELWRRRAHP